MRIATVLLWIFIFIALAGRFYIQKNSLTVRDQFIGETIMIDLAHMVQPGVIIIVRSVYGKPSTKLLGRAEIYNAGTHRSVPVELSPELFDSKASPEEYIAPGELVYAMMYEYKGPEQTEVPVKDIFGNRIARPFRLN